MPASSEEDSQRLSTPFVNVNRRRTTRVSESQIVGESIRQQFVFSDKKTSSRTIRRVGVVPSVVNTSDQSDTLVEEPPLPPLVEDLRPWGVEYYSAGTSDCLKKPK